MKNRLKAALLACVFSGVLSFGAFAQEAVTEGAIEALTEAADEESATIPSEEDHQALLEESYKTGTTELLARYAAMTDTELQDAIESGDVVAGKWEAVRKELGGLTEVTEQTCEVDGNIYTVTTSAVYDSLQEDAHTTVTTVFNAKKSGSSALQEIEWDITYPMGKLIKEAGLNTLMGLGIVFLSLLFLSFIIGRLSLVGNIGKKKAAPVAAAPKAAPAPVAEETVEEDLTDDTELVAVIAAAIAAAEGTSADGFVVRSIRKAGRKSRLGI